MKRFVSVLLVIVMCISCVPITVSAKRDVSKEEIYAQELKDLGLFRGVSETDFDLDRAPSRVEALVMLIRVLGKESEVTGDTWKHPFNDVPGWADNYVGYAYSKGLTNGQSATQFGTGDANSAMYLTFVLRALGYSDTNNKDFSWKDPYTLAESVGVLPDDVNINNFWRADVVLVSHAALSAYVNGTTMTLAQKLIDAGVFTERQFKSVYNSGKDKIESLPAAGLQMTAEDIYEECSPAVFYIEVYDEYEECFASGSGFFIDNKGTAVTNYHVIEDAYYAYMQTSDTEDVYEILGVYDYNVYEDWAVIKVDCTGNDFLDIGDASSVVGGEKVFAIGSPLGLQNTISEGIVSNPARVDGGVTYIQTNAAISSGSSGGALLNTKGEVIGITSAGYDGGQNLNFVIPVTYFEDYNHGSLMTFEQIVNNESAPANVEVTYTFSRNGVTVAVDECAIISVDIDGSNIPEDASFYVESGDDEIAYVEWDENDNRLPWDIFITGIRPGTTYLEISNDVNNQTKTIPINVTGGNQNISYQLSKESLTLYEGDMTYVSVNYICTGFTTMPSLTVETGDSSIASAYWVDGDETLPWDVEVTAKSVGTTYLKVYNNINDQYVSIPITVIARQSQDDNYYNGGNNNAYDAMKNFILSNYDSYDPDFGYEYLEIIGVVEYSLIYDRELEVIFLAMYLEDESGTFDSNYYITIAPDSSETFAAFYYYDYTGYHGDSEGNTSFRCSAFNSSFNYKFDEYSGYNKSGDEETAKMFHELGLVYLDYFMGYVMSTNYTVADLGYTRYEG